MIGINSQIATGAQGQGSVGIGFAVPINTAKEVASQIIDDGSVEHAYLGIEGADLSPSSPTRSTSTSTRARSCRR